MPPKKGTKAAAIPKLPAKASQVPSARKASMAVSTVTKTTITKTTKRKTSEIEEEAPAASKRSKILPAEGSAKPKSKPATKKNPPAKSTPAVKSKAPATKAVAPEKASAKKRAAESDIEDQPAPKRVKTMAKVAPKKAAAVKKAPVKAPSKVAKPAPKGRAAGKKNVKALVEDEASDTEEEVDEKPAPQAAPKKSAAVKKAPAKAASQATTETATKKSAPKAQAAPKKTPAPRMVAAPKPKKALPILNTAPTQVLDAFVFGEGSAGELGLGARKGEDGKKVIDVTRPRLNLLLSAKDVGVVQLSVGGMHTIALTRDNKILTWGVNDQGALGRETPNEGKMVDLPAEDDDSDSDSDDDDDSGLNPNEATPKAVDPAHFPEGTIFASVSAGDSVSFALTDTGLVYGWGTFRGNDGILGFTPKVKTAATPMLIPELKEIVKLAVGTNHVLAVNKKGKVFTWGAGEQSQLARRVVARTAAGALVPREFGLGRKKIVQVGCGDYHSFAVDDKGDVYSWGLNSFGQTGISKDEEEQDSNSIATPTKVDILDGYDIKQIVGGAHHSIACTTSGQVLVWGRVDNNEGGMEVDEMPKDHLFFDEAGKARYLIKPLVLPSIKGVQVSSGPDTCIAVDSDGKAYSWGFSGNYQTGQGHSNDVSEAEWIDNSAVRGKKLVWSGVGGQFGIVAGIAEDVPMVNGV
ncbi:uncharacterized protein L3040_003496 [Drepanopeziza brunnea f. sp. 'multigermtubi']|uniref:GDP/GTP exchange factor n=1 Tax=Marssonina brunnea f. sp. multigermtubi (strain MB_m1) TaxID=1072389 RepID=K1WSM0_MARBU|nr:GDP/GTP exchange factor [Drepanopeziza brunnea f. sp. 'multigermtubi' MB_m1]EKD16056.1 GDP/GTP exchange factor [Drepanopeziza brunnea f. sp. 'multigermtubi' MB_m1]KAJ5047676.1 hypothetical protein L3040_003496 [Drepanopeziza brunnea f. sp. 'multigermtubi']